MNTRAIAVGVDGSETSRHAVRWAAGEAARRGARLVLVHAADVAGPHGSAGSDQGGDDLEDRMDAEPTAVLDQTAGDVSEIDSDVAVETHRDDGHPAAALRAVSRDVSMVVLGWAGRGALGTALGSVTLAVASHSECPVVVVRGLPPQPRDSQPVLVGVDGGPLSDAALAHAFENASFHGDRLVALHAWSEADTRRGYGETLFANPWHSVREVEERALAERLAGWRERYPDVSVRRIVERADAREALVEHSSRARLVVVATRGLGGFTGLLLGSTGLAMVQHAQCPVMLVGPDAAHAT